MGVRQQPDWRDLTYLRQGTATQQAAYRVLVALGVLERLRDFDAVLTGSLPLAVDIPGSDLDIVCHAEDLDVFARHVQDTFGHFPTFTIRRKTLHNIPSVIGRFASRDFPVEIVGQPLPVAAQRAFRHLVVEARLLRYGGEVVREQIRQYKLCGLKTEPAFAAVFALKGDPYHTLLQLSDLSDAQLLAALTRGNTSMHRKPVV
jgi:hypothetical protein